MMDGGMGSELVRRGAASPTGLWSAAALLDAPDAVIKTHTDFIDAGARMITTSSYSCVPSYLRKAGLEHRYAELAVAAGRLAREAAERSAPDVLVAGGLPPLEESYRPDLVPDSATAQDIYRNLALALEPHVDLFLCETMSSVRESRNAALGALEAAKRRQLPVYMSWTLNEEPGKGLRSGESIEEAFRALERLELDAYLFNCTHPYAIEAGVKAMAGLTDKPTGGYPNRFSVPSGWSLDGEVSVVERIESDATERFVRSATRCIQSGATLVGGCCRIGPSDIAALSASLKHGPAA